MSGLKTDEKSNRILVFPFDLLSHYLRCLELAKRYPGAEVLFADSVKYGQLVREAGYATFEVRQFDSSRVLRCAEDFDFSWLNEHELEAVLTAQTLAIWSFRPSRVIGDAMPTLKMAAEQTGVPYTALLNGYMSRYYAETRGLPRRHPLRWLLALFPPVVGNGLLRWGEAIAFRRVHRPFKRLRKRYQLRELHSYLEELEGDETLICDEATLFPQKALPPHYHVIGPLIYHDGRDESELLAQLPAGKPVLLVCMGSSGNWQALRFLASPAYAHLTIVTAGDTEKVICGSHVIARPFVALAEVLPRCVALVCHGGNGTVYHGLRAGVPLLCLTSHFEQEWNVQRLVKLRLGIHLNAAPQNYLTRFFATLPTGNTAA